MANEYVIWDAVLGSVTIRQVKSSSFNEGIETAIARLSGVPAASEIYAMAADPRVSITTGNLAAVSTSTILQEGITVGAVASQTPATINIPWAQRSSGVAYGASGTHTAIKGATTGTGYALFIVDSITASQGQMAEASLSGGFHNGGVFSNSAPFAIDNAFTAGSQSFVGEYTLGPVSVDLDGVAAVTLYPTQVRINPGLTLTMVERAAGTIYPPLLIITEVKPSIDVTFRDLSELDIFGGPKKIEGITAYLRKLSEGGTTTAADAGNWCSYSFAQGVAGVDSISANGQTPGSCTLRFHGRTLTASTTASFA